MLSKSPLSPSTVCSCVGAGAADVLLGADDPAVDVCDPAVGLALEADGRSRAVLLATGPLFEPPSLPNTTTPMSTAANATTATNTIGTRMAGPRHHG